MLFFSFQLLEKSLWIQYQAFIAFSTKKFREIKVLFASSILCSAFLCRKKLWVSKVQFIFYHKNILVIRYYVNLCKLISKYWIWIGNTSSKHYFQKKNNFFFLIKIIFSFFPFFTMLLLADPHGLDMHVIIVKAQKM